MNFNYLKETDFPRLIDIINEIDIISALIFCGVKIETKDKSELVTRDAQISLFSFRILFLYSVLILFMMKSMMGYSIVPKILHSIKGLVQAYSDDTLLEDFDVHYQNVKTDIVEARDRLERGYSKEKVFNKSDFFVCKMFNYCLALHMKLLLTNSLGLISKSNVAVEDANNLFPPTVTHFKADFAVIPFVYEQIEKYLANYKNNLKTFLKGFSSLELSKLHSYIFEKFIKGDLVEGKEIVGFKFFFNRRDDATAFLDILSVKDNFSPLLAEIMNQIEYKKVSAVGYCTDTAEFIGKVFGNGIEISKFADSKTVHDYALNWRDGNTMAVALGVAKHTNISLIKGLFGTKRSEDNYEVHEFEQESETRMSNFSAELMVNNQLRYNYNTVSSLAYSSLFKHKEKQFSSKMDEIPSYFGREKEYLERRTPHKVSRNSYVNLIESHPTLPVYFTANNRGIVSMWNYQEETKEAVNNFLIERLNKSNSNKNRFLSYLGVNAFGDQLLAVAENKAHIFDFRHETDQELPLYTFKDAKIASARFFSPKNILLSSPSTEKVFVHDMLMPFEKSRVLEMKANGSVALGLADKQQIVLTNADEPGTVAFFDLRRGRELKRSKAHLEKIQDVLLTESMNRLITKDACNGVNS